MAKVDYSKLKDVETLLVLKQHRAKAVNERQAKAYFPGDKYLQEGLDKAEVIARDLATTNLKAEVPANPKRKKTTAGREMFRDPVQVLSEKIDKLIDVIAEQQGKKK